MKKTKLIALLEKLEMAPSKKMGQNFLIDENFLDYIVREAKISSSDNILEVGPGFGALTSRLLDHHPNLISIEFDRKLAAWLRENLVQRGLQLVEGDACKADVRELFGESTEFRLISNLPYSAGTIVVANMLDLELPPLDMLIMLQKEVAERFAAKPGTPDYSALSVRIQNLYDVRILKTIPPEVFYPQPEIESCILRLTRKTEYPSLEFRRILSRLVRTAFAHRRKKMFKQIASVFGTDAVRDAMASESIDPDIRAERVSLEGFVRLAKHFM